MSRWSDLCEAFESGEMGEVEFVELALETGASIDAIGEQLRRRVECGELEEMESNSSQEESPACPSGRKQDGYEESPSATHGETLQSPAMATSSNAGLTAWRDSK